MTQVVECLLHKSRVQAPATAKNRKKRKEERKREKASLLVLSI
jgi:hypothetical protein